MQNYIHKPKPRPMDCGWANFWDDNVKLQLDYCNIWIQDEVEVCACVCLSEAVSHLFLSW